MAFFFLKKIFHSKIHISLAICKVVFPPFSIYGELQLLPVGLAKGEQAKGGQDTEKNGDRLSQADGSGDRRSSEDN